MTKVKIFLESMLFFLIAIGIQRVCFYAYNYIAYVYVAGIDYTNIADESIKEQTVHYIQMTEIIYVISGWLITLGIIIFVMNMSKEVMMDFTGHGISLVNIVLAILMGIGLVLATEALINMVAELFGKQYETVEVLYFDSPMLTLIGIGLIIPIFEELFFRGLLLNRLSKMKSPILAIALQGILFSLSHSDQRIYLLALGIVAGMVVYKTKSVVSAILIHMVFNGMNLYMSMYLNTQYQLGQMILLLIMGGVLIVFGFEQTVERKLIQKPLEKPIDLY